MDRSQDSIIYRDGQYISLDLLKNEIDCRILRLTSLVLSLPDTIQSQSSTPFQQIQKSNKSTQCVQNKYHNNQEKRNVLQNNHQNQLPSNNPMMKNIQYKKNQEQLRASQNRASNKENQKIFPLSNSNRTRNSKKKNEREASGHLIKLSDYLYSNKNEQIEELKPMIESYKFTFNPDSHERNSGSSEEKKHIQSIQEEKIFSHVDVFLNISAIKDTQPFDSHQTSKFRTLPNIHTQNFRDEDLDISAFSEINEQRPSLNNHKKLHSQRKLLKNDKIMSGPAKRVVLTEECRNKMSRQILAQVSKKRKEAADNKLRSNVIKRIEEKYSGYFENI